MIDTSLLQDFIAETGEHLEELENNLLELEAAPDNRELLHEIFRSVHTIKGASEYLGMERIARLSHTLESLLEILRHGDRAPDQTMIDIIIDARDRIALLVRDVEQDQVEKTAIDDLIQRMTALKEDSSPRKLFEASCEQELLEPDPLQELSFPELSFMDAPPEASADAVPPEPHPEIHGTSRVEAPLLFLEEEPEEHMEANPEASAKAYEEEYDTELFDIFLQHLRENISLILQKIVAIESSSDIMAPLKDCLGTVEAMLSSANYMDYEEITKIHASWIDQIQKAVSAVDTGSPVAFETPGGIVSDPIEGMNAYIKTLANLFPQLNDLLTGQAKRPGSNSPISEEDPTVGTPKYPTATELNLMEDAPIAVPSPPADDMPNPPARDFQGLFDELDSVFESPAPETPDHFELEDLLDTDQEAMEERLAALSSDAPRASLNTKATEIPAGSDHEISGEKKTDDVLHPASSNHDVRDEVREQASPRTDHEVAQDFEEIDANPAIPGPTLSADLKLVSAADRTDIDHTDEDLTAGSMTQADADQNIGLLDTQAAFPAISDAIETTSKSREDIIPPEALQDPAQNTRPDPPTEKAVKQSIRVDAGKIDSLMNQVGELVVSRAWFSQLHQEMRLLQDYLKEKVGLDQREMKPVKALRFRISEAIVALGRASNELQEGVMKVRMLPIAQLFNRYPRLVRDLVHDVDKKVHLEIIGEETELDKMVIEEISDPLIHLIRNAVDHGCETVAEREAAGKPEECRLRLQSYHESNHVVIEISDDGRGIDPAKIRKTALEQGLVTPDELDKMSHRELLEIIMKPGFSTAKEITTVSGRGVGMDVVRQNVEKLAGSIQIDSRLGEGTRFHIKIPLTLAIIQALLVRVGEDIFTIPLTAVEETLRVHQEDVTTIEGVECIYLRNSTLSLLRLSDLFGIPSSSAKSRKSFVVVVNTGMRRVGLVVDALIGQEETVIKPLVDYLQESSGFSGATILGDGKISLILDVYELIKLSIGNHTRLKQSGGTSGNVELEGFQEQFAAASSGRFH